MKKKLGKEFAGQRMISDATDCLLALDLGDFLSVLKTVFGVRLPFPTEVGSVRSRYYLSVATSSLEAESKKAKVWGQWHTSAVAYLDEAEYPHGCGETSFCQSGTCTECRTDLRGHGKKAICPICGAKKYLT